MPKFLSTSDFKPDFNMSHHLHRYIAQRGVYVNIDLVNKYIKQCAEEVQKYTQKCREDSFGYIENTRSHVQVREYFFSNYAEETLKPYFNIYDYKKRAERWSFGADNLAEFYNDYSDNVCLDIMKCNVNNYYKTNLQGVLNNVADDGCVHPDIKLLVTNRYSFSNPNLHSMTSSEIPGIFHLPNFTLIDFDLEQPEPKLTAYSAGLNSLTRLSDEYGDFYKAVGVYMLGMNTVSNEQRHAIKTCWNAANYGAGRAKIESLAGDKIDGERFYNEHKNLTKEALKVLSSQNDVKTLFGTPLNAEHTKPHQKIAWAIQGTVSDILSYMCEVVLRMSDDMGLNGYNTLMTGRYGDVDDIFNIYYTMHDAPYVMFSNKYFSQDDIKKITGTLEDAFSLVIDNTVNIGAKASVLRAVDVR